ncbi:cytochrome P450 [Ceratobasidium sp. AG-I]|nr:cytochrome P450 [Ceratobasidium sp. AG-I]
MLDGLSNTQLGTVAAVSIIAVPLLQLSYTSLLPKPIPGVPHNPITSIWGDAPQITRVTKEKTFSEHVVDEVNKHGPIFQMFLGGQTLVVLSDQLEVERILAHGKNTDQSTRTKQMFATVIPMGQISLATNEMWKTHRRLTGPSMSKRYLERMSARIADGANSLARLWSAKLDLAGSSAFDADLDLQLATMDIIVNIMTSASSGGINAAYSSLPSDLSSSAAIVQFPHPPDPPLHASVRAMMESIEHVSTAVFPSLTTRLERISPTWRKHYAYISTFFDNKLVEASGTNQDDNTGLATDADCVVDMAMQREDREGMAKMGREELVDELMTYIMRVAQYHHCCPPTNTGISYFRAGQETTASALAWHVKYISQDPDIQRRLHDEVCAVFGQDGELDCGVIDDSKRVPVLEAVAAETLRCAQVAPTVGRTLLDDEVILGRAVPKGTQLMLPLGIISNQESSWGSDASEWKPSRWLNSDGSFNRTAGPNFSFGLGQRACFGQKLAMLQLKTFIATLSREFFFKDVPKEVGAFDPVELTTRQPKICYVSLERWDRKK